MTKPSPTPTNNIAAGNITADNLATDNLATDIAIVGSGLTALASAALLAQANPEWRIALIRSASVLNSGANADKKANTTSLAETRPDDIRTTALSASSLEIFSSMGLYSAIEAESAAINTIQVSDRGHSGLSRLDSEPGAGPLGLVIENQRLSTLLETLLSQQHNVTRIADIAVHTLQPKAKGISLTGDCLTGEPITVSTHLLMIADGSSSPLRKQLGIKQEVYDYHQTALVATLTLADAHRGVAYERFTADGPMALLPMTDADTDADNSEGHGEPRAQHRASLVWTLPSERAQQLRDQDQALLLKNLPELFHAEFGDRAGAITAIGKPVFVPLQRKLAAEQVRSHVVLMGSAAQSLHPVAGQGFNLALRDIAALAETALIAHHQGRNLGELPNLQRYLKTRERDQLRTILLSHQLPKVFASASAPMILGRNLGLMGLNLSPPLRRGFALQATGLGVRQARIDHNYRRTDSRRADDRRTNQYMKSAYLKSGSQQNPSGGST
ncbi:MAG: FAD-dependent monooxygenase [Porticoccaceae bacterium]|nr:FAD-dependent monooxygenase [Porticoccaceae bacterium]